MILLNSQFNPNSVQLKFAAQHQSIAHKHLETDTHIQNIDFERGQCLKQNKKVAISSNMYVTELEFLRHKNRN